MMGMPTLGTRGNDLMGDFENFPVLPWPEGEMPMIRHKAIGREADLGLVIGLGGILLSFS